MLSTLHRKNLQFVFPVLFSTAHVRASEITRTVSQHETDHRFSRHELNLNVVDETDHRNTEFIKENVNV